MTEKAETNAGDGFAWVAYRTVWFISLLAIVATVGSEEANSLRAWTTVWMSLSTTGSCTPRPPSSLEANM